jgi:lipopolysaccharide transport protein LptA
MKKNKMIHTFFIGLISLFSIVIGINSPCHAQQKNAKEGTLGGAFNDKSFGKLPTFITSKSLEVNSVKRVFYYRTNVVAKQGDMTLSCDELEGYYNENNQIEKMIALKNVVVVKGATMKASSERGVYETATAVITMTENPKLEQNGSILQADIVKMFLNEDRSIAEGDVSVTVINEKTPAPGAPVSASTVIPSAPLVTPSPTLTATTIPGVRKLGQK